MNYEELLQILKNISSLPTIEQEEKINDICNNSNFKITVLRKQLKEIIQQKKLKEKQKIEKEKQKRKEEKEKLKEKIEINKEIERERKNLVIKEIEQNYKSCPLSFFIQGFEYDLFKKTSNAYAKKIVNNNHIITFKDNKQIFIYSKKEGIYEEGGDIILSQLIQKELEEHATDNTVKEIINKIRRKTYISREILKKQPKKYQPVGNGLLNLENGELEEFNPKYIYFTKIDINFIKNKKCESFINFLKSSLNNDEKSILIIQEWFGNLLLNDNRFQRALLLYGAKGENGKSVLLKIIGKFLGHKNFTSISLQALEKNQFALARLATKRANIFFDLPKAALSQTSNFKLITAGDPVTGEYKGQDSFEFYPMTKMMFSCNEVPRTPDRTAAFFRRWLIIQFNNTFPEGDKRRIENLDEKLSNKEELEGILQFAFEGLKRLNTNKKFTENMNPVEVREFWLKKSDSVASFAMDNLEPSKSGEWMEKRKIYGKYQTYCEENGYEPLMENIFFKVLKDFMNLDECKPSTMDKYGNNVRVTALRVKLKEKEENGKEK
ncbi:hypothetical protein DRN73_09680 [Candidatus Pacearchaeota archaeon]|nr:MAG: hypothetical protein DRN73_09680 [Candidatus Pacearchaeota archaeon]